MLLKLLCRAGGGDDRARARDAAAGARHALQKIAVELASLGEHQELAAFAQPVGALGLNVRAGVLLFNEPLHRGGDTAGNGKAASRARAVGQILARFQRGKIDLLRLKNAHQFFIGQHKIDVGPNFMVHGFQLFRRARPDEHDLAARMLALGEPRGVDHGRVGHGDVAGLRREQPPRHHPPRRAAGRRHKALCLRDFFQIVARFLNGADVRAHGDLHHAREAELLHRGDEFRHGDVLPELPDERRGDDGDDLVALQHGADDLIDLALIDNRAERTAHKALTARDAAVIVDLRLAVFVHADGVHPARRLTGALEVHDGVIRAGCRAFAALDAEALGDAAAAVYKFDRALGAHLLARRRKAALTKLRRKVAVRGAGVTGVGDDVHERRLVILLGDRRLIHALGEHGALLHRLERQAHRQPHALARDGALQKHRLTVQRAAAGDDLVWDVLHLRIVAGIRHPRDLGKDLFANVRN